ncbi:hypothetical protein ASF77_11495 [Massilia sp. Leaf139]|nr:hypothetical protein ASF77_11495 [Massilia sp. Leaf139]
MLLGLTVLCALVVGVAMPALAWHESRRQAREAAAELALGYALDVLHRSDETSRQAQRAIGLLEQAGHPPCSPVELTLMRELDLTSTYLQAVGHVGAGRMLCSSMGAFVFDLGPEAFRTSRGVAIYLDVPLGEPGKSPLIALQLGRYAVLIHRDLPLDTSTGIPGVGLGVFQLDQPLHRAPDLARGEARRAWVSRLGGATQASFADGGYLVAVVRSIHYEIAAAAAIPLAYVDERARAIGARLVPAGVVAGLALAAAIGLLAKQQRSLAGALRHALRRGEFFLQYQPIVALDSGRCVGVEALLRWRRATGELVGPDIFIPVAEQSGLMPQLTRRVLQLVEADVGRFLAEHPDFHIALNLSAADLLTGAIDEALDGFMARSGARASNIILEITERGFLDMDAAQPVIAALRMRRLEIAIDDFGTGYSSLSYLESLALDFLKIDRSFIEAIGTRAPTSQVVGHIIAMARTMGLRMIAEGVERREQADFLAMQGVQYAQGWLYGRPAAFSEVVARYREAAEREVAG